MQLVVLPVVVEVFVDLKMVLDVPMLEEDSSLIGELEFFVAQIER